MIEKVSSGQDKQNKYKDWFCDYVVRQNRIVAAIFSAKDFRVEYLTDNAEEIIGVPRDSILSDVRNLIKKGVRIDETVPPSDESVRKLSIGQMAQAEILEVQNQITGDISYFRGIISHVDFEDGDKFLLIWTDITEEVKRNRQMEEMIAVAQAANNAKTDFLANMSHDFRTPMNAITNFNLLIAKNSDNPQKVRDYTHKIGLACQNLLSLLNDVLDMSKIESGKADINHEEFALGLLLEEVNSVIAFQAKGKQLDYQVHSGGMQQDIFIGDKKRINEILVNILGNAVKYTPKGGKIDFTISEEKCSSGEYWDLSFSVKDNGIGMSKEFQEKIFDAFTREEKEATSGIQGTGLGMAITKSLVQMMGGTISVESEEGKGSKFLIKLRLQGVHQDEGNYWKNHGIHRILIIDDDMDECNKIETALHDTDVEVFFCTSGYRALRLIEAGADDNRGFDLIFLGMQIRSISCFELAAFIRDKNLKPKPILLLLTDDWEEIAQEAREAGIYDFIQKPFFLSTFKQLMDDIFNRVSTVKEDNKGKALEGMRFLAAEDNDINADILTELMNMDGAIVERAANGKEAVEMFEQADPYHYDMILMDIQMPILNGYQAALAIRKLNKERAKEIPIIAMTANAYADDVQRAIDSGMNAHVAKPIDMNVVENTILSLRENMQST
ncbi:hybrid sensor histidine kinase/response regulator [Butyrivibrio sp. AE3004]|uniref:hybrid sensor histidine kinase/response regulator n=1 Tax=Butyrivibrio sp. AE3004 TaxID=1506994 RepID=UPI0006919B5B|nr:response regulator [Butyrivibrio sp. AE3004]